MSKEIETQLIPSVVDVSPVAEGVVEHIKSHGRRNKKDKANVRRASNRAQNYSRVPHGVVRTLSRTGLPRLSVGTAIMHRGLFHSAISTIASLAALVIPIAHVKNEQDRDPETGRPMPIGERIVNAVYSAGMVLFGGRHMVDKRLMPLIANTFPDAPSAAAYSRSLGAPCHGGVWKDLSLTFKDITSVNSDGKVILAGKDGQGLIHPGHIIFQKLGCVCVIQVRIWHPVLGVFIKGTLAPDDRCVDADGLPTIWVDWLQIKGKHKLLAIKERRGTVTGAFDQDGVLVNPEKLEEWTGGEGYHVGVLQTWDRRGTIKWCFEILERVADNRENRIAVTSFIKKALDKLEADGGLRGIFAKLTERDDDSKMRLVATLCDEINRKLPQEQAVDPLGVPFVWDYVEDEIGRKLYHLSQGAGMYGLRYVAGIDNGIPVGHCVVGRLHEDGEWRFNHGDEIAVTRFPMILPQALKVLKVIDPRKRGWKYLQHLVLKTHKGQNVCPWMIFMNEHDLVGGCQGDDDGDTMVVNYEQAVVRMYKSRISMLPGVIGNPTFLIEPDKATKGKKTDIKVLSWNEDGSWYISKDALKILSEDGRGPVGQLTYYCSYFLALGERFRLEALACAVLIQEAIDAGKHVVLLSDPEKLVLLENWKENSVTGEWSPVNCRAEYQGKWYDAQGMLNMDTFMEWAGKRAGRTSMKEILNWRSKTGNKKLSDKDWEPAGFQGGQNLVHYCCNAARDLWFRWKKDNGIHDANRANSMLSLRRLLPLALGVQSEPADSDSMKYQLLLQKSGLLAFGSAVKVIRNESLEPEQRSIKIEAEIALMHQKLRLLTFDELLTIWVTELASIEHARDEETYDHNKAKSKYNRAFRAVCFPGSPVLERLGVEMETPCDYLAGPKLEALFGELIEAVSNGEEENIFWAVTTWDDEDHEKVTGIPVAECKHCKDLLVSRAVNYTRNRRETLNEEYIKRVSEVCRDTNRVLQQKVQ